MDCVVECVPHVCVGGTPYCAGGQALVGSLKLLALVAFAPARPQLGILLGIFGALTGELMLLQSLEFVLFIEITDIDWAAGEPKAAAKARDLPSTPSKNDASVRGRGKMVFDPLAQMSADAKMLPTPSKTSMFYRSLRPGPLLETNCARLGSLRGYHHRL